MSKSNRANRTVVVTFEAHQPGYLEVAGLLREQRHPLLNPILPCGATLVLYAFGMSQRLPRSPELMSRDDSALLVVDVQEKLVRFVPDHQRLVWNIRRLIDGAKVLGVSLAATEQYPKGLGPTTDELAERLDHIASKLTFSCGGCAEIFARFQEQGIHKILVVGIEAHVCVQQTVLDLLAEGFSVYLAVDAVGSRFKIDYETALRRMDSAGATLTTTEAALFEWCDQAGTPEFKQISALVQEKAPED